MAMSIDDLMAMCERMDRIEEDVHATERSLARKKEALRMLQEVDIPQALEDLGIDDLTLKDGRKLTIKRQLFTSITKQNEMAAYAWLRANGFDSIIKREISFKFGKGDSVYAQRLLSAAEKSLKDVSYGYEDKESIHPSTLRSFIKDQLEAGEPVPEFFNVFEKTLAQYEK